MRRTLSCRIANARVPNDSKVRPTQGAVLNPPWIEALPSSYMVQDGTNEVKTWSNACVCSQSPMNQMEAIILAAEQVGEDGAGRDGLVGYLRGIARRYPKSYVALIRRMLDDDGSEKPAEVVNRSSEEILARRHVPGLRLVARPFVRLRYEGCSDGPSRSSRTEGEPWRIIEKRLSHLMLQR